jgi:hypothetical protein
VTPTDVEALSGGRSTTVRDVVNDLVERGYVGRESNPADRRSHLLVATEEGDRVSRLGMQATEGVRRPETELGHLYGTPEEGPAWVCDAGRCEPRN